MTLDELKTLLLTIDPALTKWRGDGTARDYTIWTPHHPISLMSDDKPERVTIMVTIDRWTKDPNDTVPGQILKALEDSYVPTDEPMTLFDEDDGYFRHIIECYVTLEVATEETGDDEDEDPPEPVE